MPDVIKLKKICFLRRVELCLRMDSLELDIDDFNKLYKLHTGHQVFSESDDSSSLSETESKDSDIYKPPLLTYEELTSNLVDYKPTNHENEYTKEKYSNDVQIHDTIINKELEKLISKTSCHICNIHNQTEHNIASHIRGQYHKKQLEAYRRNRWTKLSKDQRSVQHSDESGSVYTRSHTSNKVVAFSNPDTSKSSEEVIQEKLKKLVLSDYCYICEAVLGNPHNADSHYRSNRHKDNLKLWKCEELSKMKVSMKKEVTKLPKHLAQYIAEKSTTQKGIVQNTSTKSRMDCYICGPVDNWKDHYSSEQHLSRVQAFCFICNVRTMSKKHLSQHVKGVKHMSKIKHVQRTDNPKSTAISTDNIVKTGHQTINQNTLQYNAKKSLNLAPMFRIEVCGVCNLRFSDPVMAKAHYNTKNHKLNANKSVPPKWCYCEICEIPLDGTEQAEDHYTSSAHIVKTINSFSCHLCNMGFYSEEPLRKHIGSFPHCYIINLKHDLVFRGITSQYWSIQKLTNIVCMLCGVTLTAASTTRDHLNSRRHRTHFDNWVFQQIIDFKSPKMIWYYCNICDVKLDGTTLVELHYQGKSHLQKKKEINENSTKLKDITLQASAAKAPTYAFVTSTTDYVEAPLTPYGITSSLDSQSDDLEVNSTQTIDSFKTINDLENTTKNFCYLCNRQFVNRAELIAHKTNYPHSQLQIMIKDLIIYGITTSYWSVSKRNNLVCLLCNVSLKESFSAQLHLHSSDHYKKYTDWLERQVKNIEDVNRRMYYCDVCAIDLDGTSDAESHYQQNYHIDNLNCNKNMQWFLSGVEQEGGDLANLPEGIKDNVSDLLNNTKNMDQVAPYASTSKVGGDPADLPKEIEDNIISDLLSETNNKEQVVSNATIEIEEPIEDVLSENYKFKCYLCKIDFMSQDDLGDHCKSFPHKHGINMKTYIVAQGISQAEYWTTTNLSVNCILCSVNLVNDSAVNGHFNAKKHNSRFNTWLPNQVKDTTDPNRKWFYCDVCNVNLDGTSNAENHDKEESHIRRENSRNDSEEVVAVIEEVMPTKSTELGDYLANLPEQMKDNVSDLLNEPYDKDQVPLHASIEIEEPIEDVLSENYNFKCYLCKMEFMSHDELGDHCKTFPHKHVINMKSYIVSKGISQAEYWTATDLSVNCILCSLNLQNDSAVKGHLNSKKHNSKFKTWLDSQVADVMDPNRKWFYCDVCNINLDGTSNVENHDKEESHKRRTNGSSDYRGSEVVPTKCTSSSPGLSVVIKPKETHEQIILGETYEETILLKDEVLSELEEFTDLIYFSRRLPLRVALDILKKYNEELRKLELTTAIDNQLSHATITSNASLEVKTEALNNGKFYKAFAENSIESSSTFWEHSSSYPGFNVGRYENHCDLCEGDIIDYYTYVPNRSNEVNPSPKKPSMFRLFAWGAAGLLLVYLLKRKFWKYSATSITQTINCKGNDLSRLRNIPHIFFDLS